MLLPKIVDVSPKGQILIPADLREAYGIKPMGKVYLYPREDEKNIVIAPLKKDDIIEASFGMLAKKGGKPMTQELLEERRLDNLREERKFRYFRKRK